MSKTKFDASIDFLRDFLHGGIDENKVNRYVYFVSPSIYLRLEGKDLEDFFDAIRSNVIEAELHFKKDLKEEYVEKYYDATSEFAYAHYGRVKNPSDLLSILRGIPFKYWGSKYRHIDILSKEYIPDFDSILARFISTKLKQSWREGWDYFLYLESCLDTQVGDGNNLTINGHYINFIDLTLGDDELSKRLLPIWRLLIHPLRAREIKRIGHRYDRLKRRESNV